jgi:hypothetical protein
MLHMQKLTQSKQKLMLLKNIKLLQRLMKRQVEISARLAVEKKSLPE